MRRLEGVGVAMAVALIAVVLAGCDAQVEDGAAPATEGVIAPPKPSTPSPPPATPATAPVPARAADGTNAADAPIPGLALSGEGLGLVDPTSGATRHILFGSDLAPLIDVLTRVLGAAPERATNDECGAGPLGFANWKDGLSVLSQRGKFVGWSINQGEPGGTAPSLATMSGIGVGSKRSELEAIYAVQVMETTLGTEFAAGELYGVLDSPKPDAPITAMWAGTSCVFR